MKGAHTFQSVKNLLDKKKKMGMGVMGFVKNQLMPSSAPDQRSFGCPGGYLCSNRYQALVEFWNFVKFGRNDRQLSSLTVGQ